MKRIIFILGLFIICQSCGTTSGSFENSSPKIFANPGADSTSGYANSQNTYTIKINAGLSNYDALKSGIKSALAGVLPSGIFHFTSGAGSTSASGITIDAGSDVPVSVSNAITQYLQQSGYEVVLRRNQAGLGKTVYIW